MSTNPAVNVLANALRMGPAQPIFSPSNTIFKDAIAQTIADSIASAPANAVKIAFRFDSRSGDSTVVVATKREDVGWLFGSDLAAGVYGSKKRDGGWTVGVDAVISR